MTKSFTELMTELTLKKDKDLPNLKMPVPGPKGKSKRDRLKSLTTPYMSAIHAAKESIDNHPKVKAARKAHAAGTWDGNVNKEGEAVVHINGKPHTVTNRYGQKKQSNPDNYKPFAKEEQNGLMKEELLDEARWPDEMPPETDKNVDEALTLQQRMKRSRLMKRMKGRIAVGRKRASRKMANKKTLEKRSLRQARNELAKKLTRGIPKKDLSFARKQEIEKRLEKPALKNRIKILAKRKFKDVRKKEVERKKG